MIKRLKVNFLFGYEHIFLMSGLFVITASETGNLVINSCVITVSKRSGLEVVKITNGHLVCSTVR